MPTDERPSALRRAIERIEERLGVPDLVNKLGRDLRRTDLATLLMAVFKRRVATIRARDLCRSYAADPFVVPSPMDMGARMDFERFALGVAAASGFDCATSHLNITDGGVVDWTAKLLSNERERCIISGSGVERLVAYGT